MKALKLHDSIPKWILVLSLYGPLPGRRHGTHFNTMHVTEFIESAHQTAKDMPTSIYGADMNEWSGMVIGDGIESSGWGVWMDCH